MLDCILMLRSIKTDNKNKLKSIYWLYILQLEDDCFYIGITSRVNPYTRIREHQEGRGATWTKKHTPIKTISLEKLGYLSEIAAKTIEQNVTKEYMKRYSYNKVRGGEYTYSGNYVKFHDKYFQTNVLNSHWV